MNFDRYVQYMIQKYSLAVALAVIKTKPRDIDIEKHLNNIKNNLNESKMDSNDDICEEDFEYNNSKCEINDFNHESNDSVTILKNFDLDNINQLDEKDMGNSSNSLLDVFEVIKNIDPDPSIMNNTTSLPGFECSQNSPLLDKVNEDLTFCESPNKMEFNYKKKESEHNVIINNDSEQTELYTLADINTYISQSQDNIILSKKYLIAKANENKNEEILNSNERQDESRKIVTNTEYFNTTESNNVQNTTNLTISLDCVQENGNSKRNGSEEMISEAKRIRRDNEMEILKKSQESYILLDKDISKRMMSQTVSSLDEFEYFSTQSSQNSNIIFNNKEINNKMMYEINEITSNSNEKEYISNDSDNSDDLTESQAEIVTFKVLEELSKVKNYIKREKRHTDSDSGYKSSLTRGSYKSVLSGTCWNESAQCLLNFLNSCPLVVNVMDITEEISQVLGKLIDKLHEEEKYPNFLDKILENIENLILNVYNCGRDDDSSILNVDEKIHRIFLLNRSPHIIKFSIEKILNILENILPELQNIIEITQTEQTENLYYIFHILEILLKRYISSEKCFSQPSSQETLSQETVLKKSYLTEIWRKKWKLSKSESFEVQSSENKCIMTKCREILNKITVEAMECYSLISFSALQCYNILHK